MKSFSLILSAAAVGLLAACSQQTETSVAPGSAASAPATSSAPAAAQAQTLKSSDGKITITLQEGGFADISANAEAHPAGISPQELTLLQQDAARNITVYATSLGKAKSDAKTYFANLKAAIESDKTLENVQIGAATDNRMNYRFTQNSAESELFSENCIAIFDSGSLYNVCAGSDTASQDELAAVLKDVAVAAQ